MLDANDLVINLLSWIVGITKIYTFFFFHWNIFDIRDQTGSQTRSNGGTHIIESSFSVAKIDNLFLIIAFLLYNIFK